MLSMVWYCTEVYGLELILGNSFSNDAGAANTDKLCTRNLETKGLGNSTVLSVPGFNSLEEGSLVF